MNICYHKYFLSLPLPLYSLSLFLSILPFLLSLPLLYILFLINCRDFPFFSETENSYYVLRLVYAQISKPCSYM